MQSLDTTNDYYYWPNNLTSVKKLSGAQKYFGAKRSIHNQSL